MNRVLRVLVILLCFELGVLLVILPWSALWERNYFLDRYPMLIPYLLSPHARGAITGLGLMDIAIAAGMIRRRPDSSGKLATRS
jgi:hypothetical protein